MNMRMTFRWYGDDDPVTLDKIEQIPCMDGIVSAVYDTPVGSVWSEESIDKIKKQAQEHNLKFEVVESVPVHEDIKLGAKGADKLIDVYKENIVRLGRAGVKCVCYNFMPVFDWLRSELKKPLADGSNALAYDQKTVLAMNPLTSELSLPGWDSSYTKEGMKELLHRYESVDEETLWKNLTVFLKEVVPVAEQADVKLAIHPDDPPWSMFGLPRIVTNKENLRRLLDIVDSPYNGLTLCTGSLGVNPENDVADMLKTFAGRTPFVHLRNIKITGKQCFEESGHISVKGSLDMYRIVKTLYDTGFDGWVRPDHGRMIWGEQGRAGYGLYDRALGAMYLYGLAEAVSGGYKKEDK